jgi:hypothetical protein
MALKQKANGKGYDPCRSTHETTSEGFFMDAAIMYLDRDELYHFCDLLPEPIIARPVVTPTRERGMILSLEFEGQRVTLTENGKPYKFRSLDAVMFELDGADNVDTTRLVVEAGNYWKWH